jgi:hypothetical protein
VSYLLSKCVVLSVPYTNSYISVTLACCHHILSIRTSKGQKYDRQTENRSLHPVNVVYCMSRVVLKLYIGTRSVEMPSLLVVQESMASSVVKWLYKMSPTSNVHHFQCLYFQRSTVNELSLSNPLFSLTHRYYWH